MYVTVGGVGINGHETEAQNVRNGGLPDGTSGILVFTQDGKSVSQIGILGDIRSDKQILCIWDLE